MYISRVRISSGIRKTMIVRVPVIACLKASHTEQGLLGAMGQHRSLHDTHVKFGAYCDIECRYVWRVPHEAETHTPHIRNRRVYSSGDVLSRIIKPVYVV